MQAIALFNIRRILEKQKKNYLFKKKLSPLITIDYLFNKNLEKQITNYNTQIEMCLVLFCFLSLSINEKEEDEESEK
jgi:hypothetical protein